ncbi:MAG: Vitamin B12 import ATP-binding protein BtuD [Phycisphaerae bacterium]|nr:Vitamin B12 import ATP-binding protein BtuD [Phycisphaerae bacterium]
MADKRPIVKTIGLSKVFKDFWRRDKVVAVRDLDLEIQPGEVFGLLGPNGSGKSTTIKIILGLLYPTRGRISIFGQPPTDVSIKKRIGYLPEESYLYRFLNARETLQLYGRLFQQAGEMRASRIDKLLEMVGLQHQARRRIGEYSKGMARRIGLAQALINDPDFLILDEPTTGLDPIGTRQIKELIRELGRRGKTILLSSHLLTDVQDVCDRVCILYGGQVRAHGPVEQLLSQEDFTQITAPRLAPRTVEEIRQVIQRQQGSEAVTISHPTERLEDYFIRIVQQAQAASVVTSGAQMGGALPDFLSEQEGDALIESLVSAAVPAPVLSEESVTTMPEPAVSTEIISELVSGPATDRQSFTVIPPPPPVKEQVDQTVLDDLLGSPEDQHRG